MDVSASSFEAPLRAAQLLATLTHPWWIAGGWALDLLRGERSRDHVDVDIAVLRKDQLSLQDALGDGWQLLAMDPTTGSDTPRVWRRGARLSPPIHEIQAERGSEHAEFLLEESSGSDWVYRRDDRIRRPLDQIGVRSPQGLLVLAPVIVLLFKAKAPRERDTADLLMMLPSLQPSDVSWLRWAIGTAHADSSFLERLPSV